MSKCYYLAVDIGASSGRHIVGWMEDGRLCLEEVYRFPNGMIAKNGHLCWDHEALVGHVLEGLRQCDAVGKRPTTMAIDTWGVDFLLLDREGQVIGDAVGYRDDRTANIDKTVYKQISEADLYARTGIQKQPYNTVYQLMALKEQSPEQLAQAETLLMMPDYLNYRLTGVCHQEYTNATTAQLVSLETKQWDTELIERLGYPSKLFGTLSMPGEVVGHLLPEHVQTVGYDVTILHAASHDTASAVLAVPTNADDVAYLSSGTWSLMGMERLQPDSSAGAHDRNFTNEGGFAYRYRFLKNIMGLWIIQSIRRELGADYSFARLSTMAEEVGDTPYRICVNDNAFLAPTSMIEAIRGACNAPDMPIDELLCCVYHSLADCYADTIAELGEVTGQKPTALHIIGGGSKDDYLNALTAKAVGIPVYAGPTEATAIGNLLSQMLGTKVFSSVSEARETVFRSFEVKKIEL